jgi:exodeoxyribonuclease VII small subunit
MDEGQEPPVASLGFEEAFQELEAIVSRLEAGELTIEGALALFERGQQLAAHCSKILETAGLKVEQLTSEGEIVEVDLD